MDNNEWGDEHQSFAGGHQQNYNSSNSRPQNVFQQPRYGGQQQFQPIPQQSHGVQQPQFGQYSQQQFGGQNFQNGSQQQQFQAQQFPRHSQQAQGGQFAAGSQSSQGGQNVLGAQQLQHSRQPSQIHSGAQQQVNMNASYFVHTLMDGTVTTTQAQGNFANRPFSQATMPTRGPSGQQSSNGQSSRQSSVGSINQQILPRRRALGGQQQSLNGQQQNMGNIQQIPMAMGALSGQSQSNFMGGHQQFFIDASPLSPLDAQFPTRVQQQSQDGQSQLTPGQRQYSGSSQQFSPTAAQSQPGLLQHFAAGALNLSTQQGQAVQQPSASGQQFSPSASQFQPGAQQHFSNNQPNPQVLHCQGDQHFSLGQNGRNSQNFLQAHQPFQQTSGNFQSQDGQQNTALQQLDFMQQSLVDDWQLFDALVEQSGADIQHGAQVDLTRGAGHGDQENDHQGALHQSQQLLEQNNTGANNRVKEAVPVDMVQDPLYQQTLLQVQEWQRQNNVTMTQDQQSCLAVEETWKKKDNCKGGKRLAELDEDDLEDDIIEEAVRVQKRQRVRREQPNFHANARKVYAQGPENRPEPMNIDSSSVDEYQVTSYDLDLEILGVTAEFRGEFSGATLSFDNNPFKKPYEYQVFDRNFRLIESICCDWSFMIEVTKHLRVKDIVMLYSVSKTFHDLVNLRFQSTIAAWAQEVSPSGWKVFYWKFYGSLCISDPAGKPWAMPGPVAIPRPPWASPQRVISSTNRVRSVPGLKHLAMIAQRETRTRDIIACLARAGHRLPGTMHITLKKMWMLMDIYTNRLRRAFIRNEDIWTRRDLYNAQIFYIKLQMRFNEPIFGPKATVLADTFLGLRGGLTPLWKLLRKKDYIDGEQILQTRLRYFCRDSLIQHHLLIGEPYIGVHPNDLGNEHKEGWGKGKVHLWRPDELVVEESVRRRLHMEKHLVFMVFWGHVDWKKRLNLVPTEEEMYMSDDELPPLPKTGNYAAHSLWGRCGNVPFDFDNWQPKHAMKARWKTLTREEKLAIIKDDQDEQMRGLPFEKDVGEKFWDLPYNSNDRAHPGYPSGDETTSSGEVDDEDVDTEMGEASDEADEYSGSEDLTGGMDIDPSQENEEDVIDSASGEGEAESVIVKYKYSYEDESIPLPHNIEDVDIAAHWYDLDPYLQQKIIDEKERIDKSIMKDTRTLAIIFDEDLKLAKAEQDQRARAETGARQTGESSTSANASSAAGPPNQSTSCPSPYTSPTKKQPKRYKYPGITDPISLSLLEKYDRFAPEEFRTDNNDNVRRGDPGSSDGSGSSSSANTNRRVVEVSDYDEYDDEELKALADEDYDSDHVEFDLNSYQKFLERVGDDGGFKGPGAEDDSSEGDKATKKKKRDVKGKDKAVAVESSDDEDGYDRDEMAYEGDLDEDLPLPKYDFRKY